MQFYLWLLLLLCVSTGVLAEDFSARELQEKSAFNTRQEAARQRFESHQARRRERVSLGLEDVTASAVRQQESNLNPSFDLPTLHLQSTGDNPQ
jgi:hypothetical protein